MNSWKWTQNKCRSSLAAANRFVRASLPIFSGCSVLQLTGAEATAAVVPCWQLLRRALLRRSLFFFSSLHKSRWRHPMMIQASPTETMRLFLVVTGFKECGIEV